MTFSRFEVVTRMVTRQRRHHYRPVTREGVTTRVTTFRTIGLLQNAGLSPRHQFPPVHYGGGKNRSIMVAADQGLNLWKTLTPNRPPPFDCLPPRAFGIRVSPLAIGTREQLCAALAGTVSPKCLGRFLARWTRSAIYLRAIAAGAGRRNLGGTPAGVPNGAAREFARQRLTRRSYRPAEVPSLGAEVRTARNPTAGTAAPAKEDVP